jgi:hypothetical protein
MFQCFVNVVFLNIVICIFCGKKTHFLGSVVVEFGDFVRGYHHQISYWHSIDKETKGGNTFFPK